MGAKALVLVVVLAQFTTTYPSYRVLAGDDSTSDYAAGVLICEEAGACASDALRRELLVRDPAPRRTPGTFAERPVWHTMADRMTSN